MTESQSCFKEVHTAYDGSGRHREGVKETECPKESELLQSGLEKKT